MGTKQVMRRLIPLKQIRYYKREVGNPHSEEEVKETTIEISMMQHYQAFQYLTTFEAQFNTLVSNIRERALFTEHVLQFARLTVHILKQRLSAASVKMHFYPELQAEEKVELKKIDESLKDVVDQGIRTTTSSKITKKRAESTLHETQAALDAGRHVTASPVIKPSAVVYRKTVPVGPVKVPQGRVAQGRYVVVEEHTAKPLGPNSRRAA